MRQIQVINGTLQLRKVPIPMPSAQQILIKVQAIGVNRADVLHVDGLYPAAGGSNVPGLEVAGYNVDTNERLAALLPSGGYSEYVLVDKRHTFTIPDKMDFTTAAALPEALCTAYMALVDKGMLTTTAQPLVVVHGSSSGVGSIICQIARVLGAYVIATVSDEKRLPFCLQHGAHEAYLYPEQQWVEAARNIGGASLIIDILGGPYIASNIKALCPEGKMVVLAVMNGSSGELPIGALLMKHLSIIGSTLRAQDDKTKAEYMKQAQEKFIDLIINGKIKPHIDSVFPITQANQAHDRLRSREHTGKVVLMVD